MKNDNNNDDEVFKMNLIALLYQFRDRPHILASYFILHDALKDVFAERIKNNTKLSEIYQSIKDNNEVDKPYFFNLEEMQKYYNSLFESYSNKKTEQPVNPILGASTQEEALKKQLNKAVEEEDYERAIQLRDYMKSLGIKLD